MPLHRSIREFKFKIRNQEVRAAAMDAIQYFDLAPLFQPRSFAVIGASERPGPGSQVLANQRVSEFKGQVYAVHPKYSEVHGYPCFPTLADLPEVPDCVAIALRSSMVPGVIEEAAQLGVKAAIVFGSGFSESGEEGGVLQQELRRVALENRIPVCGPNCLGVINFHDGFAGYSAPLPELIPLGRVGAVLQSGSTSIGLLHSGRGLGFSYLISSGNEAVTEITDYIHHMVLDPNTDAIIAFVEGFRDISKLADTATLAADHMKPIIVIKMGQSELGKRAVSAHTGALAGSDPLHDAFFHEHGIIRVRDMDEALETAAIFLGGSMPKGNGVGMITCSGGEVALIGDLAEEMDLNFPVLSPEAETDIKEILPPFSNVSNPLDAWGVGDVMVAIPKCIERMASEPNHDVVAISLNIPAGSSKSLAGYYTRIAETTVNVANTVDKPVIFFSNFSTGFAESLKAILDEGGVPLLQGTQESLRALSSLIRYATFQRERRQPTVPEPPELEPELKKLLTRPALSENQAKQLLKAYQIPVPREILATTLVEAQEAATKVGYPLVLKVDTPDIQHKTEASALRLGIRDEAELTTAYEDILRNARTYNPDAEIRGVSVQEMVDVGRAVELIAGLSFDPQFGHCIAFGFGGVFVEIYKDVALRLVPIDEKEARSMVQELKGKAILEGARGRPKVDVDTIVEVLVSLSTMAVHLGDRIAEVDINPLFAMPEGEGVIAGDALVIGRGKKH